MIRLLYISHAASGVSDKQVQDILESARRNNPANRVTGVLVHGGGQFMQVLEGPEQVVLRQYVKILDDRRHSDARILHISPANDRIFEKWSMGVLEGDPLQFQHISELRARRLEAVQAKTFTDTMREFVQRLRAAK
jgi:acetylglutamate kinase